MLRLGCGAGFSSDRLEPAVNLARDGQLDYLVFETIGERTLAFGHRDRRADPSKGYNPLLSARMRAVLPYTKPNGTRIITNMGVANVTAAAEAVVAVARDLGLSGLKVAAVSGDDVTNQMRAETVLSDHGGRTIGGVTQPMICANAYLGADAILPAIQTGADVIITGRVADPSMFVAPLIDHYGWSLEDWTTLGQGTVVGHLMECGMQITGGYFADPGVKDVPDVANCGYPIAEVDAGGSAVITKLTSAGGLVSAATVKEQLLYEVHDPAAYLTPDVTADFSHVSIEDGGANRVAVRGGMGHPRPEQLKVTVGFDGGFLAEAEVSYAGINARKRAQLAGGILRDRLGRLIGATDALRIDLIGINALHATANAERPGPPGQPRPTSEDVRVRAALRTADRAAAEMVLWETEALLCCGPAGGGGYRGRVSPSVMTQSAFIAREAVTPRVEVLTA